jgi:crotonobetainyl-CoA:carnitine CoA-transferase CaiB-like acyl-CoA transferase
MPWRTDGEAVAADWPAAAEAGRLLTMLGRSTRMVPGTAVALSGPATDVAGTPTTVAQDWAHSGAMALTGRPDGPCLHAVGRAATIARAASLAFELVTGCAVDGPGLLGERAALMGLRRGGRRSAGGGTRLLRAADGWWALNLSRDRELVPALTSRATTGDAWDDVEQWARDRPVRDVLDRTTMLGMAAAGLAETPAPAAPWRISTRTSRHPARDRPRVVNLGALWAGPLAANLLGLAGADVIDVESSTRPDPSRISSPAFHALLHADHQQQVVDFSNAGGLHRLLESADIVIEASRPRALQTLHADADSVLADGRARTWLRITGHRDPHRVAFGDDAAVAGGLVAWDDNQPVFAGDAIADPLTGLLGALAVVATHSTTRATLIDIALADTAAYCAARPGPDDTNNCEPAPPRIAYRRADGEPIPGPGPTSSRPRPTQP